MFIGYNLLKKLGTFACIIIIIWLVGYIFFIASILHQDSNIQDRPTDAIIVLTGGAGRINTGLDLLAKGYAHQLFISGVGKNVNTIDLFKLWGGEVQKVKCCTTLDYLAYNTRDNAIETKKWMRNNNFQSLILVTSSYHMPRALLEFKLEMPLTTIIIHPVKTSDKSLGLGFLFLVLQEYNKSLLVYFRSFLKWL